MTAISESKQKAAHYLKTQARPLERALYAHYFEHEPQEKVLAELIAFQNEDGGFGRALEPDVRLADSSVIATTIAFQHFRALKLPAEIPMVRAAAQYLLDTYDAANKIWPIIPPNVDDAPHAPWWEYRPEPEHFLANPRVEIVGYLYDYPDLFPQTLRNELTEAVMARLGSQPEEIEMHDLQCYVRLSETRSLPDGVRDELLKALRPRVEAAVARDPADWVGYGLTPLTVVSSPESPFYAQYAGVIPENLDFILRGQSPEGHWSPPWSWGDPAVAGWQQAERDWRGVLTLNNLLTLMRFAA